jgi:CHAD domain-containing protein
MPIDQDCARLVFDRLDRQLSKLADKPQPQNVHRFRTYTRRVEALIEEVAPKVGRNEKKLLKMLNRLRRRAGRIRDLDVQIVALRNLRIPGEQGHKTQLLRMLNEIRSRREGKLHQSLDKETLRNLRKRLKKTAGRQRIPGDVEPLALAKHLFAAVSKPVVPLTESILHKYRLAGKRVRYVAELAGKVPEAEAMLETLQTMQDALGDWHDWLMLTESAEKLLDNEQASPLMAALRNVTRAKFRHALQVVGDTRLKLLGETTGKQEAKSRQAAPPERNKPSARQAALIRVAAA